MNGMVLALLLRPLALAVGAVFWFFGVILVLRWLYPRLPKSRVIDFLFKERGNRPPDYGPGFKGSRSSGVRAFSTELLTPPTVPGPRGNMR